MLVLHVNWADGALRLWAESLGQRAGRPRGRPDRSPMPHPFALAADDLARTLAAADRLDPAAVDDTRPIRLALPCDDLGPCPSDRLAAAIGVVEPAGTAVLAEVEIGSVALRNDMALSSVLRLEDRGPAEGIAFGHTVPYWIAVARFALELLADQRFIPTLIQARRGAAALKAAWKPWLHDASACDRLGALLAAMPPVVRAVADDGDPWRILAGALDAFCDATVRRALVEHDFIEAIDGRDPAADPHVAWLAGLLGPDEAVAVAGAVLAAAGRPETMLRDARAWLGRLEDAERVRPFRLCLSLAEPPESGDAAAPWSLSLHLKLEGESVLVDAERIWSASPSAQVIDGHRIDRPQELLLTELGRASRIYPVIEAALSETHPTRIELATEQAAQFLREYREVLEESGFEVVVPEWWGRRTSRLGVRLQIDSPPADSDGLGGGAAARVGLDSLVRFRWQVAIGDESLSADELAAIVEARSPLVRVAGRWVDTGALAAAGLLPPDSGGEAPLREAIELARSADDIGGLPVLGMDAHGWVGDVLGVGDDGEAVPIPQPETFMGTLRPYQKTGLSWLAFLERFGFGACLADDMGLGKTIQLIALLLHERLDDPDIGPTLLVVPTSLIPNWVREVRRFAPSLACHVHHGPQREAGEAFARAAAGADIVITTYALVPRDRETINSVDWWRVVLDEAQYIKNPPTQQAGAIRALRASRRIALTGTPIENRLSELWSIIDFCNPGYLGPAESFRRRCAVPIERHRDRERAEALRNLVRPFILRRLKSDPAVIVDLPPCLETREYAYLTAEQASLYQATVDDLLATVDRADGIQRRGWVLAALTRLKQICNHPAQPARGPGSGPADGEHLSSRSGKCRRLVTMLEELLATGERALIFTQYRRMGHLLSAIIRQDLDCETLFMHGGTTPVKRQAMIDRFQSGDRAVPFFILSLKTGGIGLNLTAANHVFHFDRWWNPAVENQATDRAYRIGQTRTVHVHKFVCEGTLEERIDEMIEQKSELAEVIHAGDKWITELSSQRLRELLELRATALEIEA